MNTGLLGNLSILCHQWEKGGVFSVPWTANNSVLAFGGRHNLYPSRLFLIQVFSKR